ncbi:MAG: hypothetical protein CMN84_11265 [Spongiibacteraceae bacterium]|nr:hypothetical protein [Spongiibacteraceae bacterium]
MAKKEKGPVNQRRIPKQKRAIAKYNAVLDACAQVLAKYGYQKATVLELSLVSDVPVATIYQYFPDKESIFQAWFERTLDQLFEFMAVSVEEHHDDDIETFIYQMIRLVLDTVSADRESVKRLITDLPHIMLSHLLTTTEKKTVAVVATMTESYLGLPASEKLSAKLHILTRCILGFMLQYLMAEESENEIDHLSDELRTLSLLYLADALNS